jgi:hypothetical protein
MAIVAAPLNYEVNEFTQFTLTVTLTDDEAVLPLDVKIQSATINDSGATVVFTDTTFTVAGKINDAFTRSLNYLDKDNVMKTAATFSDIPQSFNSLTKYTAPSAATKSIFVKVTLLNHPELSYEIIARNNFAAANAQLKTFVAKGRF